MTEDLVEFVLEQTKRPLDRWAVAATLESGGIRDVDARERFGMSDVFELADDVLVRCLEMEPPPPTPAKIESRRARLLGDIGRLIRGGFFFVQLGLQFGSLMVLGYGQWSSLDFTRTQASVVGIALLLSLTMTGPSSRAIGQLGSYFGSPGKHVLAERAVALTVVAGLCVLALGAGIWWVTVVLFGWYGTHLLGIGLVYYTLIGILSLSSAALYLLKQFLPMVIATVVGIATVGVVFHQTGLGIYAAHWAGLGVGIAINTLWAITVLHRRSAGTVLELRSAIAPPAHFVLSLVAPFALYGAGYFALIFVDRLAAWSTDSQGLPFTFRSSYEVGLDWALISVVPALAFLEVTVYGFSQRLAAAGKAYEAASAHAHSRELLRFYRRHLLFVIGLLGGGIAVTFWLLSLLKTVRATRVSSLFADPTVLDVYILGVVGYALLVVGVFNVLFLFSVTRPWAALATLAPALPVAAAVAFVLSRTVVYWAAAGGLVAGSAVFALLATVTTRRILRSIDYHYFAAY